MSSLLYDFCFLPVRYFCDYFYRDALAEVLITKKRRYVKRILRTPRTLA